MYYQLLVHQNNGETLIYCYLTRAAVEHAQTVMLERGARAAIRKQYVY